MSARYENGNSIYYSTQKARVLRFPTIAAARAVPNLFDIAESVYIDGIGHFYADTLSVLPDDGYNVFQVTGVATGRFILRYENLVVTVKGHATSTIDLILASDASTAVLPVVLTGLLPSSIYHAVVGVSECVGLTTGPQTGGFIDIISEMSIATDAGSVATCTIGTANLIVDITKLELGVNTMTGNITASAGGFTIYATRVAGTSCTVFEVEYWISRLVKVA